MDSIFIILIIVLVLALAGMGAWFSIRQQRSRRLREHFGPEYERSIEMTDNRGAAESDLREREKRHRELDIRPLNDEARTRFADRWTTVQQGFVDNPGRAVRDADELVEDVMGARGYPLDDFEQRAADISVEHPIVVQRYREARVIAEAHDAGRASTEDLRQAVTSYRALIAALLEPETVDDRRPEADRAVDGHHRAEPDDRVEGELDADIEHGANARTRRVSDPDRHESATEPHDPAVDAPRTDTPKETRA